MDRQYTEYTFYRICFFLPGPEYFFYFFLPSLVYFFIAETNKAQQSLYFFVQVWLPLLLRIEVQ